MCNRRKGCIAACFPGGFRLVSFPRPSSDFIDDLSAVYSFDAGELRLACTGLTAIAAIGEEAGKVSIELVSYLPCSRCGS
jgi:hypothetical protein